MPSLARRDFLKNLAGAAAVLSSGLMQAFPATAVAAKRFKLGAISDGFSLDFEQALTLMKGYGLEWVEIRNVWGKYNTEATPDEIRRIKQLLGHHGFRVSVVDTALYKCALPGTKPVSESKDIYPYAGQMDLLKRAAERAHAWGTDKLRIFAFWRVADPQAIMPRVVEELDKAGEAARAAGVRLVIEDEETTNGGTAHELARMIKAVKSPNIGVNWDVGNGYEQGEVSFPDGYNVLPKDRIWHLHVKGMACDSPGKNCREAFADQGVIDLAGQIRTLHHDHYTGTMSLECEFQAPGMSHQQTTQRSMEGLLKVLATAA